MADEAHQPFKVDRVPKVSKAIRRFAKEAERLGLKQAYVEAWEALIAKLRTAPLEWGEPIYNAKKAGGVICQGVLAPLSVTFVTYEAERVVLILEVRLVTRPDGK